MIYFIKQDIILNTDIRHSVLDKLSLHCSLFEKWQIDACFRSHNDEETITYFGAVSGECSFYNY